ncbi:MAG: cupin domain-containing protein [Reyranella sp.]|nr:cupin domain-containing protein [Reyranella sp.]
MNGDTMTSTIPDSTFVEVAHMPWQATRFAGIEWKILMEDKSTGMFTALMRWAPGARLPEHEHAALEQTYVLEGSFADDDGVCTAGNFVWRRKGSRHDAWTDEGCLMLAFFLKPNMFLDGPAR